MISRPSRDPTGQQLLGRYAVGVAAGVLLALLTSYIPVVAILGVGALVVACWAVIARGRADQPTVSLAGIVLGSGFALLYGAVATISACSQTDTFCGNANVTPLLVFAVVAVASGLLGSAVVMRRTRR